jgi:Fe-S-cluster-containing dehydrogenase component
MKKWNLVVDIKKCVGCFNCFLACKDEHIGNEFKGYARPQPAHGHQWIDIDVVERGQQPQIDLTYVPKMCNHCDNPKCLEVGGDAVEKRADGIVIIHPEKAKGRKDIVDACPYGAIFWNEEENLPQAWYFDAHLLDNGWKEPRCVQSCATGALTSHKIQDSEMAAMVKAENLEVLKPELGAKPRVYYKNLHLAESCFLAGSVLRQTDGIKDCAADVVVTLRQESGLISVLQTDAFGDFKFDALPGNSGRYFLDFQSDGKLTKTLEVTLENASLSLGDIVLDEATPV